ncbi:ENTH-domain-containing protein [Exidia glandulosa HHB12029]|uniref:ENTH-domain-containing protein n=1 Tax=Exidia glandulosa HHB12029 TaxID=1314781 RepID=A0A165ZKD2_EXIGL|nr:ENTH-domain-containing protein [Exidia glandulosa HHB12029]
MSSLQHMGKSTLRVVKNYTKGYSDVQSKVRDATSNDPWGPSGTQMNELAQMTYNQNDFVEIMEMLDKRLNDKGKNWRHVFKSLTVLDYLLHAGSENVVIYFRDNLYIIKTLKEFQFVDEYGKDQGANVRQKAKDITNLLMDESRLREERRTRASMRDRLSRGGNPDDDENAGRRERQYKPPTGRPQDDDELRRAIELSKRTLEEEQNKAGKLTAEELDLQKAIKLSEEEDAKRRSAVEDANSRALFDDNAPPVQTNPFPLVDTSAGQFGGLQPQFTQLQPQFTSFNPYAQQAQQEALQMEYLRQQQAWQAQQEAEQLAQLHAQQQAQLQAQYQQQQQQEEWMRQQQLLQFQQQQAQQQAQQQQFLQFQQSQLQPQPTGFGSNNPFALGQGPQPPQPPASAPPVQFNLQPTQNQQQQQPQQQQFSAPSPPPQPASAPPRRGFADEQHAHLAGLFANAREGGVDTFGNTGELRYGQQIGKLQAAQTGHNPFHAQQQQQQQQQSEQPFFSI